MTVVNQPIKVAWIDDELFLEANPSLAQSVAMEEYGEVPEEKISNDEMHLIVKTAGEFQDRLRWPAIRTALKERNGYPVSIARRPSLEVQGDEIIEHVDTSEAVEPIKTPEEAKDLVEGYEPSSPEDPVVKDVIEIAEEKSNDGDVYDRDQNPFRTLNP